MSDLINDLLYRNRWINDLFIHDLHMGGYIYRVMTIVLRNKTTVSGDDTISRAKIEFHAQTNLGNGNEVTNH